MRNLREVQHVSGILQQLAASTQNSVPDAVLNAGKCVLIAPAVSGPIFKHISALMSCRVGEQWSPPVFLLVDGITERDKGPADLMWIVNGTGANAIERNHPQWIRFQPGPLVRQFPVLAETQVRGDVVGYRYRGGALLPSAATIRTVYVDDADAAAFYGGAPRLDSILQWRRGNSSAVQPFVYAVTSYFNTIYPVGILIHHSGLVPIKVAAQLKEQVVDMIDEFHARRGFEIVCFGRVYHVGYHYLILPNGKVEPGRPERCEGAHARGYNSFIGIALVGDFSPAANPGGLYGPSTPTRAQMRALIRLCRRLRQRYHIPIQRVMRHSDVTSTSCPGSRFPIQALLRALESRGPS